MCIILVGQVSEIRKVGLEEAWACNPDGGGIAYPDNRGKVKTIKGLMTLKALREALSTVSRSTKIALHLRLATHGSVSQDNTHPFPIGKSGSVLMHNGVLTAFGKSGTKGVSDSADFARVLGEIKDPRDREKMIDSLTGMFAIITPKGILVMGSKHWVNVGKGDVIGSNDHFVAKTQFQREWHQISELQKEQRNQIWRWREDPM